MLIDDDTTLKQLQLQRLKLGVTAIVIELDTIGRGMKRHAHLYAGPHRAVGSGATDAEALRDAFAKLETLIGQAL